MTTWPPLNVSIVSATCAEEIAIIITKQHPDAPTCTAHLHSDVREAIDFFRTTAVDIAIIDIAIPIGKITAVRCGLQVLAELKRVQPNAEGIVLTTRGSPDDTHLAMKHLAYACVDKCVADGLVLRRYYRLAAEHKMRMEWVPPATLASPHVVLGAPDIAALSVTK